MTTAVKCPICRKPPLAAFTPFCSRRCADVDLNRWLVGGYRVENNEPLVTASAENAPESNEN
jgi:endogenous inhibitor of DNA gyrase (YacG/DUF329 family)